jgi:glycosyltransferase involved in cell wall biosynthesis
MKVGYLVNVYPKVSHAFIRREIAALEGLNVEIQRYTLRRAAEGLVDPADVAEAGRTIVLLEDKAGVIRSAAIEAAIHPLRFLRCLRSAARMARAGRSSMLKHFAYVAEACHLAALCRRDRVDHLHAHFGTNPAAVAMFCSELGGPPFSFTVHGPDEFDAPIALGLAKKVAAAKFVAAISSFTRSQLMRWSGPEDWRKIHVIRCGVDEVFLSEAGTHDAPAGNTFTCVARLSAQKGHFVLLEAIALLKSRRTSIKVVLIGDGELRRALEGEVQRLGITDQVTFRGNLAAAQIREQILASRATVLPSFAEGLPVVIMESLALGRPVITTYIAGIPELVKNGINGWLVPAGSAEALADAIEACLAEPVDKLAAMGHNGTQDICKNHHIINEAKTLSNILGAQGANERLDVDFTSVPPCDTTARNTPN